MEETVEEPRMPPAEITPNVQAVRGLVLPFDESIKLEAAAFEYGACHPGTQEFREVEPGRVQFSCSYDDGTIIQFEWNFESGEPKLRQFTFTSMNDAEFSGVSLRGQDALDALESLYKNQPLF